jgi:hypothetical protein
MTDYQVTLRKHRRLAILHFLEESQGFTSNVSILTEVLNSNKVGITSTRDQTATELVWLSENGFVTLAGDSDFWVATATTQGVDIALGRSTHPHIQRPSPRV